MTPRTLRLVHLAALLAAAWSAGCASSPGVDSGGDPDDGSAGGPSDRAAAFGVVGASDVLPLSAASFRADLADLAVAVYPTPRTHDYGPFLLPLDGAHVVTEESADADARLRDTGLEAAWAELPAGGYVLAATRRAGRTEILRCARDDAGRAASERALRQMTVTVGGRPRVRACRVADAPLFPFRGNKRPQPWELAYGANFSWENRRAPDSSDREVVATFAPGSPLDATRAGAERVVAAWRDAQDAGVRRFCLKFDDVGFGLTPESTLIYGEYPVALTAFAAAVQRGLRARDSEAVLYWLPQTYWWTDERLPSFAAAVRAAGGLPRGVGLVMTGPEIISRTIEPEGLAASRRAFGCNEVPALLYDNLGREGDWGPLTGRDPRLRNECDGVFGERGTPVHRLTRLDWLWNPVGYDPERSWRRAVLELAGPAAFDDLLDVCEGFRQGIPRQEAEARIRAFADAPPHDGPVPRAALVALLRTDLRRLRALPIPVPAAATDGAAGRARE
ncbi:MAG: hypothetical protein HMLKMBBP_01858 [Planctomycetes bacterium]|nr:hypothetical protein [Planctomycetota bacterium]